jgi:hypothetical protein
MPVYKLDPGRLPLFWDLIKPGLILGRNISGISGDWDFANRVLENALVGRCTIWLAFEPGEVVGDRYVGFGITTVNPDAFSNSKDLVLYFAYMYRTASVALRNEAAISLVKYAKKQGCQRIVMYTERPGMESIIEGFLGEHAKKRNLFTLAWRISKWPEADRTGVRRLIIIRISSSNGSGALIRFGSWYRARPILHRVI